MTRYAAKEAVEPYQLGNTWSIHLVANSGSADAPGSFARAFMFSIEASRAADAAKRGFGKTVSKNGGMVSKRTEHSHKRTVHVPEYVQIVAHGGTSLRSALS